MLEPVFFFFFVYAREAMYFLKLYGPTIAAHVWFTAPPKAIYVGSMGQCYSLTGSPLMAKLSMEDVLETSQIERSSPSTIWGKKKSPLALSGQFSGLLL